MKIQDLLVERLKWLLSLTRYDGEPPKEALSDRINAMASAFKNPMYRPTGNSDWVTDGNEILLILQALYPMHFAWFEKRLLAAMPNAKDILPSWRSGQMRRPR
jgi:hypothetical protein